MDINWSGLKKDHMYVVEGNVGGLHTLQFVKGDDSTVTFYNTAYKESRTFNKQDIKSLTYDGVRYSNPAPRNWLQE